MLEIQRAIYTKFPINKSVDFVNQISVAKSCRVVRKVVERKGLRLSRINELLERRLIFTSGWWWRVACWSNFDFSVGE